MESNGRWRGARVQCNRETGHRAVEGVCRAAHIVKEKEETSFWVWIYPKDPSAQPEILKSCMHDGPESLAEVWALKQTQESTIPLPVDAMVWGDVTKLGRD